MSVAAHHLRAGATSLWLARAHERLGWAGLAGAGLLVIALLVAGSAWQTRSLAREARATLALGEGAPAAAPAASSRDAASAVPHFPARAEVALLLTQIEQTARDSSLDWRAADFRIIAATASRPASLEVRFSAHGSYPQIRAMLAKLLRSGMPLAIREFSVSRPSADVAAVEAKLVLAVFLRDGAASTAGIEKAGS